MQLTGDNNTEAGARSTLDFLLDMQYSEFLSIIGDRYTMPTDPSLIPLIITKWVAVTTAIRLFSRRNDRPKQLDADEKWATDWTNGIINGIYTIPNIGLNNVPVLQDSDLSNGLSRWDFVFSSNPSPTGPINPNGNAGGNAGA